MAGSSDLLAEQLSLEKLDENTYVSKYLPIRMGHPLPIAYGGFTLGIAVNASCMSVKPEHYLYSATGCFLGPVSTEQKVTCLVERLRTTRTFTTQLVKLKQGDRLCMVLTADFRLPEPAMLTFDPETLRKYPPLEKCKMRTEYSLDALREGMITKKQADTYNAFYKDSSVYCDIRPCPESMSVQNFNGLVQDTKTSQHDVPMSDRTTVEWCQINGPLEDGQRMGAAAFLLDSFLAFLPLAHSNLSLTDAGPASSLDFAIRIFSHDLDVGQWHLTEKRALCSSLGLTHSVTNMFDKNGRLVAQMSEQCILRVKPASKEVNKAKL